MVQVCRERNQAAFFRGDPISRSALDANRAEQKELKESLQGPTGPSAEMVARTMKQMAPGKGSRVRVRSA